MDYHTLWCIEILIKPPKTILGGHHWEHLDPDRAAQGEARDQTLWGGENKVG